MASDQDSQQELNFSSPCMICLNSTINILKLTSPYWTSDFDTVPHDRLLHKMNAYGVQGSIHKWLSSFLNNRHMNVVVEGEHSKSVYVESGVPQGTVFGPLTFLCHINNLPDTVTSQVRLFADDCLLYRQINKNEDHLSLQQDLNALEKWASEWGMKFNAKKCYIMSIRNYSSYFYQLDSSLLYYNILILPPT